MEILVTLRKRSLLERVLPLVDGVIIGRFFTSSYHLSSSEMRIINNYCKANEKKVYVQIDDFVTQDDLSELLDYMGF
ncbi:MAG: hypothetical protein J6S49_09160, partial [Erysipelotrichaceae bacterium]|nr:hypothetical protein [Erysipelotrichaceae bacterium]